MKINRAISKLIKVSAAALLLLPLLGVSYAKGSVQKEAPSRKQARWLVAHAETPAQHAQLASYYRERANRCLKEAGEHNEMAATNPKLNASKVGDRGSIAGAGHCRYWSEVLTKRARHYEALAAAQEKIAQETTANR